VRSGWLHRSVREIPYARIHNVNLHQSLLHRLFGVAEVRLESAGGAKPEAQMRVLRLDQAEALEALVRRGQGPSQAASAEDPVVPPLLTLPNRELVRLGLVSNRGMLVVLAAAGGLAQAGDNLLRVVVEHWGRLAMGWASGLVGRHVHDGPLAIGIAAASLLLAALLALRLLSVAMAFLQYYGFTLREDDARISVERGLLARSRSSARRSRVQTWSLHEGVLHRALHRRSLRVRTAAGQRGADEQQRALKELAPIATPQRCDALIAHFLPGRGWDALDWQPLHRHAWLRMALPSVLLLCIAAIPVCWRFGAVGACALLLLPLLLWRARRMAACAGWACNGRLVAWRHGWWDKAWNFAELGKVQAWRFSQSPLERRLGMASLLLDTAGASPFGAPLHLRHLPQEVARALSARLGTELAHRRLQW
ncbi:MAG: hypothetical protein EOP93_18260, partial [Lysobacteraceae bacterium]